MFTYRIIEGIHA